MPKKIETMTPESESSTGKTPDFLDAHVHFWDPRTTPRAVSPLVRLLGFSPPLVEWAAKRIFPKEAVAFFRSPEYIVRPYLPETLEIDRHDIPLDGVVHVEAGWQGPSPYAPVEETRWLEALQGSGATQIKAIVAHANLGLGDAVSGVLAAHLRASERVRGIRDTLTWHPDKRVLNGTTNEGLSKDPKWRAGFAQLGRYGLSFDATVYHTQIDEIVDLARAFPEQPIVLCHLGTPVAVAGQFAGHGKSLKERNSTRQEWEDAMIRLASCPNVHLKLSGLLMPVCGFDLKEGEGSSDPNVVAAKIGAFINFGIDTFGVHRCQFASNFPVEKVSTGYSSLYRAFHAIVDSRSEADQVALFRRNAEVFYRIEEKSKAQQGSGGNR